MSISLLLPILLSLSVTQEPATDQSPKRDDRLAEIVKTVASFHDLKLTDEELELMLEDVATSRTNYAKLRDVPLDNSLVPPLYFRPGGHDGRFGERSSESLPLPATRRPENLQELAFWDIPNLGALIRSKQVSVVELTELFLERLERHDATLFCLVNSTPERALAQAAVLDSELAEGRWRGPLHGIPWVAKDLLSVPGTPTTWGAKPFRDQVRPGIATVVERLDDAGAVLLGKVSLGALAWGDVWFGGTTRNPWNPEKGSSGSSAGSASATAAGLATFAIGSETLGSIVSPCEECGTTGLRPSFGMIPKGGAMNLSWSMDKLGPIARSVRDAAIVFDWIRGAHPGDPSSVDSLFEIEEAPDLGGRRVGYLAGEFDDVPGFEAALEGLRELGAELVPVKLPEAPAEEIADLLAIEAASVFESLTRSGRDDELTRQVRYAWPNVFRQAQLVSAVDYLRANRMRTSLIQAVEQVLSEVDALVHPNYADGVLHKLNLTGHPTVVVPAGFNEQQEPFSLCFSARLFHESDLCLVATAWQRHTAHHLVVPKAYRD